MVKCPDCNDGKITALVNRVGRGCRQETLNCFRCGGKSEITEEMLGWMIDGRALRDLRVARKIVLSEAARLCGLEPAKLGMMQLGMVQPIDPGEFLQKIGG